MFSGGMPTPVSRDGEADAVLVAARCAMVSVPPLFHGGHGVADQVRQHLHDLVAIDFGHRIGQAVLDVDGDAVGHGDRCASPD